MLTCSVDCSFLTRVAYEGNLTYNVLCYSLFTLSLPVEDYVPAKSKASSQIPSQSLSTPFDQNGPWSFQVCLDLVQWPELSGVV